ncbi:MAG TPA: S46 family peptidase [Candidatus Acidoferrales bacterium]|nr:S46 family peptidase [Candidatus Acidoferrales bacterium]
MKQALTFRIGKSLPVSGGMSALLMLFAIAGCSSYQATLPASNLYFDPDTVKAGRFDTGKMWTFDNPPAQYFQEAYGFTPDQDWFDDARLGALRLSGCTASFISEDGLVLTNHHCARTALDKVNKPGEDLPDSGFYAPTLNDERKVDGMYADQLVLIKDVTTDVQAAFERGKTDEEKIADRTEEIKRIQKDYWTQYKKDQPADSMIFQVVNFFNGGKYSLYGYKRYTDVRLVFAPQMIVAYFGGDPDNFTYPRYDVDFSLFRIYDHDKPLKAGHYFKWSKDGAKEGEPVFVVGNPGRTSRLLTVSQLEFNRDYSYPFIINLLQGNYDIYDKYIMDHPDKKVKYETQLFFNSNSLKAINGYLSGLRDPYLMARKKAFEKEFKEKVMANPSLAAKYGSVWNDISAVQMEKANLFADVNAYNTTGFGRSQYLSLATRLVQYANNMKMPDSSRPGGYQGAALEEMKSKFFPSDFNPELEKMILAFQLKLMQSVLGTTSEPLNKLLGGRTPEEAADFLEGSTEISDSASVAKLLSGDPNRILTSSDPFIQFIVESQQAIGDLSSKYSHLTAEEGAKVQLLGRALFDVYGATIPPDATFTLRIADGVVKGYEYNGTIAPTNTTYYGMYDRYYSFGKKYPWSLPGNWQNPPVDFNLSTPLDFVATNDIIGGNSGSPVLNKELQVVGLIFDGNIESLPGDFIYVDTYNRSVAVHSDAIPEALKYIYHADRLVNEIKDGKIQ